MADDNANTTDETTDKWNLAQYGRGTEITLDGYDETYMIVDKKMPTLETVTALKVVDEDGEPLWLQHVNTTERFFDVREAECEGGQIKQAGGRVVVKNTANMNRVTDFEVHGRNEERLKQWFVENVPHYG